MSSQKDALEEGQVEHLEHVQCLDWSMKGHYDARYTRKSLSAASQHNGLDTKSIN